MSRNEEISPRKIKNWEISTFSPEIVIKISKF
jgi:hypothetical protein